MRKYLFYFCLSMLPFMGFGQILEEGFDDITTLMGDGWVMTNQSDSPGTTEWFQGNDGVFSSYEGATTSYIGANYNNTAGSVISNWLITPTVNVKDGDVISFYTRTTDFTGTVYNDRLEVRMSTGTMTAPTGTTGVGSFTTVMGIINDAMNDSYPHTWTMYEYTVSGVGSTPVASNFAFRYNVPSSAGPLGSNSDYIGIDSVMISGDGGTGGDCDPVDVPYTEDFESAVVPDMPNCTTTENAGTGNDWATSDAEDYGFTGQFLRYKWNSSSAANAWFFTQGINLEGGSTYKITYDYGGTGTTFPESLRVAYGTDASSAGMTMELADHPGLTNDTPITNEVEFTADADGVYYFGFNAYSDADQFYLYVDNIHVEFVSGGTGGDDDLLIIDLSTENQLTITATTAASMGTVSGGTTTGFYLENVFSNADEQAIGTITAVGTPTLTAASVPTDNSPAPFRSGNTDPGLNVWSYSTESTTTFTTGEQAFTGDATWTISPELYAALLTSPESGNVYFPADDVTDLGTATMLGTYSVIMPNVEEPEGCLEAENGQYPTDTFMPACNGMPQDITTLAWTGEYSMVQVTAGTEYIFSVSDPTYFITIGNEAGDTVLASGTGSVTWTSDADQLVRFYGHFDSDCNWDSATFYSRTVQCGEVPPPPSSCEDYVVLSNNLENGLFFGGDTAQHLAADIPMGDMAFSIAGMEPTFIGEATMADFTFYEDAGGLPGTELGQRTGTLSNPVVTGSNFGYDFIKYTITFDSPMAMDANTTYWVEIESDAVAWESTSASILGYDDVFYNTNVGEGVWTPTGGDEFVFNLLCDEVSNECSTEYTGTMQDGLGDTQALIIANDFPVTANTTMHIDQFTVNIFGNIDTGDVYIYEDAGGVPGTELDSAIGLTPTSETLIGNAFGFNVYQYVFDFSAIDATAGDTETLFWVGLMTTMGTEASPNYWEKADANTNNDAVVSSDGGVTWTVNSFGQDGAFKISGMCEMMGVSDMSSYNFAYYPNPVKDVLNIESGKTIENVSVYNLAGQSVMNNLKVTNGQVNMSGLTPGVYVFRVMLQGGEVETFKIVKK